MAQHLMARSEVLDELEDHLQDAVEQLTRAGHSPEEAVDMAMARLGQPGELAAEFAKVPSSAPWLPVRVAFALGALLPAAMVMPLWPKLTAGGLTSLLAAHMGLVMLGYLVTLLVGFLSACYFIARLFRGLTALSGTLLRPIIRNAGKSGGRLALMPFQGGSRGHRNSIAPQNPGENREITSNKIPESAED